MTSAASSFGLLAGSCISIFAVLACSEAVFSTTDPLDDSVGGAAGAENDASAGPGGERAKSPDEAPDGIPIGSSSPIIPRGGSSGTAGNMGTPNGMGGAGGTGGAAESAGAGMTEDGTAGEGGAAALPYCAAPIHDTWHAQLGTAQSSWSLQFGDPFVDASSQRLVISYDDIAKRNAPLQGGYYAAADITFEGHTVLTPYPYVSDKWLPSLRLDAAGSGIELGSTKYGVENTWHEGPGGFTGVSIPATTVRMTLYIQATRQALAVKVQAGDAIYRSGWITDFTGEQTDLSILQYVGENNSSLYGGTGDYVYIGTVDGCEKLSDSAVEQFYAASY